MDKQQQIAEVFEDVVKENTEEVEKMNEEVEQEVEGDLLDDILETKDEEIQEFNLDRDNIIVEKKVLNGFFRFVNNHYKAGNDVYTRAVFLLRKEIDVLELTYNNDLIYGHKTIKLTNYDNPLLGEYIVDADSLIKVIAQSSSQTVLVSDENKVLYGYLYGGDLFLQTQKVSTKFYNTPDLGKRRTKTIVDTESFINVLQSLLILSETATRAEERAVYFENEEAFVYSGAVFGKFNIKSTSMTLQNFDIHSLVAFFGNSVGELIIEIYEKHIKFKNEDGFLIFLKKKMSLSDDVKVNGGEIEDGIRVDPKMIRDIAKVLYASPTNSGIATLKKTEYGIDLVSITRNGEHSSNFPIYASIQGKGLSKESVNIPLKMLIKYLEVFSDSVLLNMKDKLYIKGETGYLVVSGISK